MKLRENEARAFHRHQKMNRIKNSVARALTQKNYRVTNKGEGYHVGLHEDGVLVSWKQTGRVTDSEKVQEHLNAVYPLVKKYHPRDTAEGLLITVF